MRWVLGALVAVAVAAVVIAVASSGSGDDNVAPDVPASKLTAIKGTDLSRVTLSADAMRHLGIRTAPVLQRPGGRQVIPYAAVLYAADGQAFTYTSPKPRQFVRAPIDVIRIDGSRAILKSGPPSGTPVVTVGSQELYGTEHSVEED